LIAKNIFISNKCCSFPQKSSKSDWSNDAENSALEFTKINYILKMIFNYGFILF